MGVPMVSTSGGLFGNLFRNSMFHLGQDINSFHKNSPQGT